MHTYATVCDYCYTFAEDICRASVQCWRHSPTIKVSSDNLPVTKHHWTSNNTFFPNSWTSNNDCTLEALLPFFLVHYLALCEHIQNHAAHYLSTADTNTTGTALKQTITHWHHHTKHFMWRQLVILHPNPSSWITCLMFYIGLCTGNCTKSTPSVKLLRQSTYLHHYWNTYILNDCKLTMKTTMIREQIPTTMANGTSRCVLMLKGSSSLIKTK